MSHSATDIISTKLAPSGHVPCASVPGAPVPESLEKEKESTAAFTFVGVLAADASSGEFDLPSWPEVVVQIRRALEDEDCCIQNIERLIGSEPVLAARILKMANSALISRSEPVCDLRGAINRLGFEMVRSVAISLAMEQIFNGETAKAVKPYLADLWLHSTKVAALAYLLARRMPKINADEAYLAGLVHDIGKLYVLMRAKSDPVLFDCEATLQEIMDAWHTSIGRAIVESWHFSENIAVAVGNHEERNPDGVGPANVADVIFIANLMAKNETDSPFDVAILSGSPAYRRLGLNAELCDEIILASEVDLKALHQTLRI